MKKRIMSTVLAIVLIFALAVPALAVSRTVTLTLSSGGGGGGGGGQSNQVTFTWDDAVREVEIGQNVTLSVTRNNTNTQVYYQWRKDGSNISNNWTRNAASSITYTINNAGFSNAGKYSLYLSGSSNGGNPTANTNTYPIELKVYANVTFMNGDSVYETQKSYDGKVTKPADPTRSGYIFTGWLLNGAAFDFSKSVTSSVTLTAGWEEVIKYTVTYNANNAKGDVPVDTTKYDAGTTATVLGQGSLYLQGYTFVGWNTAANGKGTSYEAGNSISINANVTLYAQWKQNIYHITYDANGADGTVPVDSMDYAGMVFGQAAGQGGLSKKGYSFTGWNTAADGSGTAYQAGAWVSATGNVTLYAQWTANKYAVTFDYKSGTGEPSSKEVTYDSAYGDLPVPTRDGYVFNGWSLDGTVSMTKRVTANTVVSTDSNHTLYALWALDMSKAYNITYDANGADGTAPVDSMDYAGMVFGQAAGQGGLSKKGYSFTGWNTAADGSGTAYQAGAWVSAAGNVTLYAQWTANKYAVTFDYKSGTGEPSSKEVTYDSAYGDLPVPTRDGYVFNGWSLDGTVSMTKRVTANTVVSTDSNHTLYALWALDMSKAYNITYDANGADGTAPVDTMDYYGMVFGQAAGQGGLSKKGYSFTGWNTAADGSGTAYQAGAWVSATGNVALYAQWTANKYTVTFDYKSGTGEPSSKEVTYDSAYGDLPVPTRDGYVFKGWSLDGTLKGVVSDGDIVSVADDHTLKALWANDVSKAFNITYDANGADGTAPVDSMDYVGMVSGQAAGQGNLSKKGYSFTGWNTAADGSGTAYKVGEWVSATGNVTLYAQWEIDATIDDDDNDNNERSGDEPEKNEEIEVKEVSHGNGKASVNFDIRSANGKGYKVYIAELDAKGNPVGKYKEADVSYNSKGAQIKGLSNGKTYSAYVVYDNGKGTYEESNTFTLKPSK